MKAIIIVILLCFSAHLSICQTSFYPIYSTKEIAAFYANQNTSFETIEYIKESIKAQKNKVKVEEEVLLCPILFNIIDTPNKKSKVTTADVLDQLDVINRAFAGFYDPNKVDTKIKFCLGTSPGNGSGIDKVNISSEVSIDKLKMIGQQGTGKETEAASNYINVWIVDLESNLVGVGISPLSTEGMDGIIINSRFFKNQNEEGAYGKKNFVHLIGRYLGLKPIWGDDNCTDDGISDTPIHRAPNTKCYRYGHLTGCSRNTMALINNFMDALPDECAQAFTEGQKAAMRTMLLDKGLRSNLKNGKSVCK